MTARATVALAPRRQLAEFASWFDSYRLLTVACCLAGPAVVLITRGGLNFSACPSTPDEAFLHTLACWVGLLVVVQSISPLPFAHTVTVSVFYLFLSSIHGGLWYCYPVFKGKEGTSFLALVVFCHCYQSYLRRDDLKGLPSLTCKSADSTTSADTGHDAKPDCTNPSWQRHSADFSDDALPFLSADSSAETAQDADEELHDPDSPSAAAADARAMTSPMSGREHPQQGTEARITSPPGSDSARQSAAGMSYLRLRPSACQGYIWERRKSNNDASPPSSSRVRAARAGRFSMDQACNVEPSFLDSQHNLIGRPSGLPLGGAWGIAGGEFADGGGGSSDMSPLGVHLPGHKVNGPGGSGLRSREGSGSSSPLQHGALPSAMDRRKSALAMTSLSRRNTVDGFLALPVGQRTVALGELMSPPSGTRPDAMPRRGSYDGLLSSSRLGGRDAHALTGSPSRSASEQIIGSPLNAMALAAAAKEYKELRRTSVMSGDVTHLWGAPGAGGKGQSARGHAGAHGGSLSRLDLETPLDRAHRILDGLLAICSPDGGSGGKHAADSLQPSRRALLLFSDDLASLKSLLSMDGLTEPFFLRGVRSGGADSLDMDAELEEWLSAEFLGHEGFHNFFESLKVAEMRRRTWGAESADILDGVVCEAVNMHEWAALRDMGHPGGPGSGVNFGGSAPGSAVRTTSSSVGGSSSQVKALLSPLAMTRSGKGTGDDGEDGREAWDVSARCKALALRAARRRMSSPAEIQITRRFSLPVSDGAYSIDAMVGSVREMMLGGGGRWQEPTIEEGALSDDDSTSGGAEWGDRASRLNSLEGDPGSAPPGAIKAATTMMRKSRAWGDGLVRGRVRDVLVQARNHARRHTHDAGIQTAPPVTSPRCKASLHEPTVRLCDDARDLADLAGGEGAPNQAWSVAHKIVCEGQGVVVGGDREMGAGPQSAGGMKRSLWLYKECEDGLIWGEPPLGGGNGDKESLPSGPPLGVSPGDDRDPAGTAPSGATAGAAPDAAPPALPSSKGSGGVIPEAAAVLWMAGPPLPDGESSARPVSPAVSPAAGGWQPSGDRLAGPGVIRTGQASTGHVVSSVTICDPAGSGGDVATASPVGGLSRMLRPLVQGPSLKGLGGPPIPAIDTSAGGQAGGKGGPEPCLQPPSGGHLGSAIATAMAANLQLNAARATKALIPGGAAGVVGTGGVVAEQVGPGNSVSLGKLANGGAAAGEVAGQRVASGNEDAEKGAEEGNVSPRRRVAAARQTLRPEHDLLVRTMESLGALLETIGSGWGQLDVFQLSLLSNGHPLVVAGMYVFEKSGVMKEFRLSHTRLYNFLSRIEDGMLASNPYHNAIHVCDVLCNVYSIITSVQAEHGSGRGVGGAGTGGSSGGGTVTIGSPGGRAPAAGSPSSLHAPPSMREDADISSVEMLGGLLAATIHDYCHPGVNNDFLTNTRNRLALVYNDRSVLENHHVASAYLLMDDDPEVDLLAGTSDDLRSVVRKLVVQMVLATDLKSHFELVERFKTRLAKLRAAKAALPGKMALKESDWMLLLSIYLKVADIGHLTKSHDMHVRWVDAVMQEFFRQGEEEKRRGLPVSPFMDKASCNLPKAQVGFFSFIGMPLLQTAASFSPGTFQPLLNQATKNMEYWNSLVKATTSPPHPPGEPLPPALHAAPESA
eukprot:jgi/Mesvir1/21876/Mv04251-RA.1